MIWLRLFVASVMLLLAAGRALAGDAGREYQHSFLQRTPAQLHHLEGTALSAEAAAGGSRSSRYHSRLMLGRKATPSLYGSLQLSQSSVGYGFGADGAFKILDRLVLGVGLRHTSDGPSDSLRGSPRTAWLSREAVLVKGDPYEAGVAIGQLRLRGDPEAPTQQQSLLLLHGRWRLAPAFAIGAEARRAPYPQRQTWTQLWSYGLSIEASRGPWKVELLDLHAATDQGAATSGRDQMAIALYFDATSTWAFDLRAAASLGPTKQQGQADSRLWQQLLDEPTAYTAIGLGCTKSW